MSGAILSEIVPVENRASEMTKVELKTLRSASLFAGLSDEQGMFLLELSRVEEHDRGHVLFMQGDPAPKFYLMLEGWVTVSRAGRDGEQTVLHVVREGETFAEPAALTLGFYPASAEAASNATLLAIQGTVFTRMLREDPDLGIRVISQLSQRLRFMVHELERQQVKTTSQRVASFLLDLAPQDSLAATVCLPYDKSLVAARLGMKPESLSRALAKLRKLGVSANRGPSIEISNCPALRAFSDEKP